MGLLQRPIDELIRRGHCHPIIVTITHTHSLIEWSDNHVMQVLSIPPFHGCRNSASEKEGG